MKSVLQSIRDRIIVIDTQVDSLQSEKIKLSERAIALGTLLDDPEGILLLRKALK